MKSITYTWKSWIDKCSFEEYLGITASWHPQSQVIRYEIVEKGTVIDFTILLKNFVN